MKKTFGQILYENKGIGPGFDFVRVFLALSVLASHVPETVFGSSEVLNGPVVWIFHYAILPMFFGLSGFLVAGSAQRLTLKNFALNRGIRIVPALVVEIFLSALIIGPIFTSLKLPSYFTGTEFWTYFLNILGFIHYRLPGLFIYNPTPYIVNGSLWTVPFEILCYLVMACLVVSGLVKRAGALVLLAALWIAASMILEYGVNAVPHSSSVSRYLEIYVHSGLGPLLVPCFLLGAAAYTLRDKIAHDIRLFSICILAMILIGGSFSNTLWNSTAVAFLVCPVMIYIVCFVGLTAIPKIPYYSTGDYSYGIYLYGYPIQQMLVSSSPLMKSWPLNLAASIVAATVFATFSWHVIEKPILKLRKGFSFAARLEKERREKEEGRSV